MIRDVRVRTALVAGIGMAAVVALVGPAVATPGASTAPTTNTTTLANTAPIAGIEPAPDTFPNDGLRILVIGDSITGNPGCWRAHLWQALTDEGHAINHVGTRHTDECGGITNAAGDTWDPDNTGISGITVAGMFTRIGRDGLLQRTTPDAVVMMLGTNDLMGGADSDHLMKQYQLMVDVIRRDMPEGFIVVAAPPPIAEDRCPGCQAHVDAVHEQLPGWASDYSTPESPVHAVLHTAEFTSDPEHMHDGIHPTAEGEIQIAAAVIPVVSQALTEWDAYLNAPPEPSPSPSPTASADAETGTGPVAAWYRYAVWALVLGVVLVGAKALRQRNRGSNAVR